MLLCKYYITVALLGITVIAESTFPVIETESGPVRGAILSTVRKSLKYASFKGIPFAEPPIGQLRFKPPVEKRPWTDILDATKEGNVCPQYVDKNSTVIGSEDCLYINVFTPYTNFTNATEKNLKSVMVWIYGGGFTGGVSNTEIYGPDYLLEDDVIVVSFNYRLGAFGFLNINHKDATGNAGLKDQNLALKWVKKHIAKFGGNPNDVTIFGQSAGAVSVDLHVLSEMSSGLFSKSISMSGSPLCLYWGTQGPLEAQINAFSLGAKLGVKTLSKDELLQGLYNASMADIINKSRELLVIPFRPTVERTNSVENQNKFLSECTVKKYLSGKYNKGPHMMGFTSKETIAISRVDLLGSIKRALQSMENATLSIDIPRLKEVVNLEPKGFSQLSTAAIEEFVKVSSDLLFVTGIDSKQKLLNMHNKHPIYYYRFSYDSGRFNQTSGFNITGAGHADDVAYLFYSNSNKDLLNVVDSQNMINTYVRLFTNFAKYGDPTPDGQHDTLQNIDWPPSGPFGLHLEIDKRLSVGLRPIDANVEIYELAGLGTSPILNHCL